MLSTPLASLGLKLGTRLLTYSSSCEEYLPGSDVPMRVFGSAFHTSLLHKLSRPAGPMTICTTHTPFS